MMLGLAIGDALGNTSEGMRPHERRSRHGEVRSYLQAPWGSPGETPPRGYPSDDTQLAFWTLEQMLEDGGYVPQNVATKFTQARIFGIGATVRQYLENMQARGRPWYESGVRSAGNGALMRIAPILIPHSKRPSPALWVDTTLCAMTTHNDSASISACLAFVGILWELLSMARPPRSDWYLQRYIEVARGLECDDSYRPRGGRFVTYQGPLWRYAERVIKEAMARDWDTLEACESWGSGAYLLETVPSVLYVLARHGADPEEAIIRAVNDTWDNDTVGAIVGAAVGALHGGAALPARWRRGLAGRLGESDDGHVQDLLEKARRQWGS
jgi:ADP-ribosylglycohydrolase